MWMGISNPFLGVCVMIASALDNWFVDFFRLAKNFDSYRLITSFKT